MDDAFRTKMPLTATRAALLPQGDDAKLRELIHALLAFTGRLQAIRDGFAAYLGLSGIQYTILSSVAQLGRVRAGGVGIRAIADHLHLSGAFVTIETQRLAAAGLVTKQADPDDRRRVLLRLSEAGSALLRRLAPIQRQVNDRLFDSLDADRFRSLVTQAGALVADADRALRLLAFLRHEPQPRVTRLPAKKKQPPQAARAASRPRRNKA